MVAVGAGPATGRVRRHELADLNARRGAGTSSPRVARRHLAVATGRKPRLTPATGWVRVTEVTDGGTPAILAGPPDGTATPGTAGTSTCTPAVLPHRRLHRVRRSDDRGGDARRFMTKVRALGFDSSPSTAGTCARPARATGTTCTPTSSSRPTRSLRAPQGRQAPRRPAPRCNCLPTPSRPTAPRTSPAGGSGNPRRKVDASWNGRVGAVSASFAGLARPRLTRKWLMKFLTWQRS